MVGQERGVKTISFKYRPKARSRITKGHRQELHLIKVTEVAVNGTSAKAIWEAGSADREKLKAAAMQAAAERAQADAALAEKLKVAAPVEKSEAKAAVKPSANSAAKPAAKSTTKPAAKKPAVKKPAAKKPADAE